MRRIDRKQARYPPSRIAWASVFSVSQWWTVRLNLFGFCDKALVLVFEQVLYGTVGLTAL